MHKKTINDIDLSNHRILMRVDFNVPLESNMVKDDTRIRAALPTINAILEAGPQSLVLMSHLGRPRGERNPQLSLAPVLPVFANLLGREVQFANDCVGPDVEQALDALPAGGILLLENTRFHPEEKANDPGFAAKTSPSGRCLRQRRLRHSPSRPCQHNRRRPSVASRRRSADRKRNSLLFQCRRRPSPSLHRYTGRCQSLRQNRRNQPATWQGR